MQSSHRKRPRRLSATFVRTINLPGRYGDGYGGHGLSLLVKPAAHGGLSKSWAQAIRPNGRTTSIGLGAYPDVTLAAAREKALDNARAVAGSRDPRRRTRRVPTFAQACETVIAIHAESWKGGRNEREWRASLREYAMPSLAARRVDAIDTADVMAVLRPIWSSKRQTARRLRQRIGAVMKWAVARPGTGRSRTSWLVCSVDRSQLRAMCPIAVTMPRETGCAGCRRSCRRHVR